MTTNILIRSLTPEDIPSCEEILRGLPDWFGIEDSLVEYIDTLSELDGYVADLDGSLVGFVGLKRYGDYSIEIDVIGVRPEFHRSGIGHKLLEHVESHATTTSTKLLHMKTIAPTSSDPFYAGTRLFWEGSGFIPMDTPDLWDQHNPCLVMVKPL